MADGSMVQEGKCQEVLCCPGLVCKMVEEVIETGRESGQIWKRVSSAKCVKPTPGEELEYNPPEPSGPTIFKPQVTIPGSITIAGLEFRVRRGEGIEVTGDTFARYLSLFYRFFVALLMVAGVMMITWGGFKRIMAAGSTERIADANDVIFKAIIGLVLALISYSLLNLINPKLVKLQSLDISQVRREGFEWETEEQITSQASPSIVQIVDDPAVNLTVEGGSTAVDISIRDKILLAAQALQPRGYGMYITSSYRTSDRQQQLIDQNCPSGATSSGQCRPPTCLMKNGPTSCPHTTGRAVDVWGTYGGGVCIRNPEGTRLSGYCSGAGKQSCLADPCQTALIEALKAQGFCLLESEPWHFEQPKMSTRCY